MAGIKISSLPAVTVALDTDFFPVVQGGITSQETLAQVQTLFGFTGGILDLAHGGTSASLTAANGAIPYSTASAFALLAPGSTGQLFRSGGSGAPTWTTSTYPSSSGTAGKILISDGSNFISSTSIWPNTVGTAGKIIRSDGTSNAYSTSTFSDTYAINTILYNASANTVSGLATANNGVLITSAGGVPSISSTLPSAVQTNITALGALVQALNMNSHLINNVTDPVSAQDAATKNYVDSTAQGLNPKPASAAATTGTLTVTYNNGSSGVGATLTNAGALAAFSVDGYSASVGDVILIKDQSSSFQNGLYTVTTVGSGAVNWVLTRSTSMDIAAEFKGGYTFVINGTVNGGKAFVETATVVTVGTDAVTFVQFSSSKVFSVSEQIFTSNGTYTPTTGMVYSIVELIGGGGGGGGAVGSGGTCGGGGGGGGGGYTYQLCSAAGIGASAAVVIGAAGTAGASGNNNGGTGGASTFTPSGSSSTMTSNGGVGGNGSAGSAVIGISAGGAGGSASGGDININGQGGTPGFIFSGAASGCIGGNGGSPSKFGLGGVCPSNSSAGVVGSGRGSGGSGGTSGGGANVAGAAGTAGYCLVTEYLLT